MTSQTTQEPSSSASSGQECNGGPSSQGRAFPWPTVLVVIVGLSAATWFAFRLVQSASSAAPPLPILGAAPDFALVERSGRSVTQDDLRGKIWLANFVFTRCLGPCPELSLRMRSIQESLGERMKDVTLVSFALDPTFDTPSVLQSYARQYQADERSWLFLTGIEERKMHKLVEEGFKQTVERATGAVRFVHSTYFVLVDRLGRVRGYYDGLDAASKPLILRDIDGLLREAPGS